MGLLDAPGDPQIAGVHDDGTSEGAIRAKVIQGDLVKVPFRGGQFKTTTGGSAVAAFNAAGFPQAEDGVGSFVSLTVPAGLAQAASVAVNFYGAAFGIRIRRDSAQSPFSVVIDGVAYRVPTPDSRVNNNLNAGFVDGESLWVVADDLPVNVQHTATVYLHPTSAAQTKIVCLGYLADKRAGYEAKPRQTSLLAKQALTTTATKVRGAETGTADVRGARKVYYYNTDASARVVTLYYGTDVVRRLDLAAAGSAGDSAEFDPGALFSLQLSDGTNLLHKADANSVVNYFVVGGW